MNASNNRNSNGNAVKKVTRFMDTVEAIFIAIVGTLIDMISYPFKRIFKIGEQTKAGKVLAGLLSMGLAVFSALWAFGFAMEPPAGYTGEDVALIVGAVLTPITAIVTGILMKFVFIKNDNCVIPTEPDKE